MGNFKIVTGKQPYVRRKVAELLSQGYTVMKMHTHPNGDVTVKLERA